MGGAAFIHPYNDPLVAAGQGTISLELLEQVPADQIEEHERATLRLRVARTASRPFGATLARRR